MTRIILIVLACFLGAFAATSLAQPEAKPQANPEPKPADPKPEVKPMQLGNFSLSLTVKDLPTSMAFYEKLGFRQRGGNPAQKWVILQNGAATIGLFQGMFEKNTLTFNPGWDNAAKPLPEFTDVRELQKELKARGITPTLEANPDSSGPAFIVLTDPDGNPVLIDQHVPKTQK